MGQSQRRTLLKIRYALGAVLGAALVGVGVWFALALVYLAGALLIGISAAAALTHPVTGMRVVRRGSLPRFISELIGLLITIAVAGAVALVPLLQLGFATGSGVLWRAEAPSGTVAQNGAEAARGKTVPLVSGQGVSAIDATDGSVRWQAEGRAKTSTDGDLFVLSDDAVTAYSSAGKQQWNYELDDAYREREIHLEAAHSGYLVLSACEKAHDGKARCDIRGLDSAGDEQWHRGIDVAKQEQDDLRKLGEHATGHPLPPALLIAPADSDEVRAIDPATGETATKLAYPSSWARDKPALAFFGDVFVAAHSESHVCVVEAYSTHSGKRLWRNKHTCGGSPRLRVAQTGGDDSASAYIVTKSDETGAFRLITASLRDGRLQERALPVANSRGDLDGAVRLLEGYADADQLYHADGNTVSATATTTSDKRWTTSVPGTEVVGVDASSGFVTVTSRGFRHPYLGEDNRGEGQPRQVTLLDRPTGEVISSTLFTHGTSRVQPVGQHTALVFLADRQAAMVGKRD
jgi:outer membrane protein assembly factor BamB